MSHSLPLDTLIGRAREAADAASRELGHCHAQHQNAERQLAMLRGYRHDYLEKLQTAMQTGLAATDCHNYRHFIATLDAAIAQQGEVLRHTETQLDAQRTRWQATRCRLKSFETLQTRQQRARAHRETRLEQRASDEYASRLALGHTAFAF